MSIQEEDNYGNMGDYRRSISRCILGLFGDEIMLGLSEKEWITIGVIGIGLFVVLAGRMGEN